MGTLSGIGVVTGGSSGIGFATAQALAAAGVTVVIASRGTETGHKAAEALKAAGGSAQFIKTDVSQEADVKALFDQVQSTYGRLDYLFNNAGTAGPGFDDWQAFSEDDCDSMLSINVKSVYMCLKYGIPLMLQSGGGVIVNTASPIGNLFHVPGGVMYGASKAAVTAITRSLAPIYQEQGIRHYAVCPFTTETPMLTGGSELSPEAKADFARLNPSGVLGKPEDVATLVMSLFAGTADYQNGDVVLIDNDWIRKLGEPLAE